MNFHVRPISYQTTLDLRAKILRPWLKPEECVYPKDKLDTTLHFGAYRDTQLVGIATFEKENHPYFPEAQLPYRLRGMATDVDFQRKGVGRALLITGENILRHKGSDLLWFNARQAAFPFYQSMGYQFSGDLFELPEIGPHKVMYKQLQCR